MKLNSLSTILLLLCVNVNGCNNNCVHIGNYQGDNVYMCNEKMQQSENIELNINIKIPTGVQITKVINSVENNNVMKKIDYINNSSLTNYSKNTNNNSLYNKKNNSLISPSPITVSSSVLEPSSVTVPSSVLEPSPVTVSSSVLEPSSVTVPSSVLEPSPVTVPSSVLEPSPVTVPSSVLEPSPVTVPSSNIIDDMNNQNTGPSLRLRGVKNNTLNETSNELLKKNNDQTTINNEQPNLVVVITLSVTITILIIVIIGGVVCKVKNIKKKVNNITVGNVEVNTREFRRKFEEAKRMKENAEKNIAQKNTKIKTIENHQKLLESKKVSAKISAPPIRKKRVITNTPPPGMGFKKGEPAPEPNKLKSVEPITPKSEN